jgi:hypothetical protein
MTRKYYPRKPYEVNHYKVGYHAIKRMRLRLVSKGEVGYNLRKKPLQITPVVFDIKGRPSYRRLSDNKTLTCINPKDNFVTNAWHFSSKLLSKLLRRKSK